MTDQRNSQKFLIFFLIVAILSTLVLSGCGNDESPVAEQAAAVPAEPTDAPTEEISTLTDAPAELTDAPATDEEAAAVTDEEAAAVTDEEAAAVTDEEAAAVTDEEAAAVTDEEAAATNQDLATAVTVAATAEKTEDEHAAAQRAEAMKDPNNFWPAQVPNTFENDHVVIEFGEHARTFILKSETAETGINPISTKPFTKTHYILATAEIVSAEYDGLFRVMVKAVNWHGFSYEHDGEITFTPITEEFYIVGSDALSTERMFDKLTPDEPSDQFYNNDFRVENFSEMRARVSDIWLFGIDDVAVSRLHSDMQGFGNGFMSVEFADGGGIAPKENGVAWDNILGWVYVDPVANPKEGLALHYFNLMDGITFK